MNFKFDVVVVGGGHAGIEAACAAALAQDYGGTYTAKNASGGTVMLTLAQDGQKRSLSWRVDGPGMFYLQRDPAPRGQNAGANAGDNPPQQQEEEERTLLHRLVVTVAALAVTAGEPVPWKPALLPGLWSGPSSWRYCS